MKKRSWISIVFSFASQCKGKIILSVICALVSVASGLVPYWSVYHIITSFIDGSATISNVWVWSLIAICGYAFRYIFMVFLQVCPMHLRTVFWRTYDLLLPSG